MTPQMLTPLIMLPLVAFFVWRRIRSTFGRQPIRRKRMTARIVVFAVIGGLMAMSGLHDARLLEGLLGGLLGGALLGLVGLRLTRFERGADGADAYIPNPWIGGLLTALLLGRLAWRLLVVLPQMESAGHVASNAPPFGNSPLTLAMFGLLIGYYLAYFIGLLIHHRRFERAQADIAAG
jgi:heme A synthase